mmetsp:Transcript_30028/g.87465  ORF Transcript_30028/g.87465 Transcript_30028/m.87465 type:complete len:291 (-) Transcript_30028:4295-5167(-)
MRGAGWRCPARRGERCPGVRQPRPRCAGAAARGPGHRPRCCARRQWRWCRRGRPLRRCLGIREAGRWSSWTRKGSPRRQSHPGRQRSRSRRGRRTVRTATRGLCPWWGCPQGPAGRPGCWRPPRRWAPRRSAESRCGRTPRGRSAPQRRRRPVPRRGHRAGCPGRWLPRSSQAPRRRPTPPCSESHGSRRRRTRMGTQLGGCWRTWAGQGHLRGGWQRYRAWRPEDSTRRPPRSSPWRCRRRPGRRTECPGSAPKLHTRRARSRRRRRSPLPRRPGPCGSCRELGRRRHC